MTIGPSGARRYYTNSEAPAPTPKISTDIWPMLPPFLHGSKMWQILAQISTPVVFGPPYYWTEALYRKTKRNLSRTDDRPTTVPKWGWVGPPNSQNRWRNGYPKGQKWKFSYISSIPATQAEYSATSVIPPVGAVPAVKRLACHITQFAPCSSQGVTHKGKSGKFLIYPPCQRPTPSTPPPMLYHLLGS